MFGGCKSILTYCNVSERNLWSGSPPALGSGVFLCQLPFIYSYRVLRSGLRLERIITTPLSEESEESEVPTYPATASPGLYSNIQGLGLVSTRAKGRVESSRVGVELSARFFAA